MKTIVAACIVTLVAWGLTGIAGAQSLDGLKPEQEAVLLDGRLELDVPAGTRREPRRASIMAAEAASEDETRLMLDVGDARLVILAEELYATGGDDFAATAKMWVESWSDSALPFEVGAVDVADKKLQVQSVTPKDIVERDATFVFGLLVMTPDGLVQMVSFYVNPAGAKDLDAAKRLVGAIARTVRHGDRQLELGARRLAVPVYGYSLALELAEGTSLTVQPGPDFTVLHVLKVGVLGKGGASAGIYVGGHPSYQHRQQSDRVSGEVETVAGKLAGADVDWHVWSTLEGRKTHEAILAVPSAENDTLHVFVSADDEAAIKAMRAVIDSLEVERK